MIQETSAEHFLQRPCDEREGSQKNPEYNWSAIWSPNHSLETETRMVSPHLKIFWHGEDYSAGDRKKEQKGEENRRRDGKIASGNGVWWLSEGSRRRKGGKPHSLLLQRHLWCPDDRQSAGSERRWDEMSLVTRSMSSDAQADLRLCCSHMA